jgi:apolipoprotein N-acyltransferase
LRLDSYFLIGGDRPVEKEYFENYGIFINREGEIVDQYLKQHPVPFGEYIPFRKYLDWIPPLALVPRDMIRGDGQKIFMVNDTKISTVISFEGSFQRYIRNSVLDGAELVVILTNQASYGESGMSDQFILMSRANAISNERPIVHAAITGKSAFIDHNGKVISKSELFETTTLNEKLEVRQTETPYSKYGNYLNYIFIIIGAITFVRRFIRPID